MDNKDFFNSIAYRWDEISHHDENKLNEIIKLCDIKENSKIIDVGTGTGVMLDYLLKMSPKSITAIDISENMIEIAKNKHKDPRITYVVSDFLEFNDSDYDYAVFYSVYPHFVNKEKLFKHVCSLLKKDGKIIIAHSESKEKINEVHSGSSAVKDHILPPASITSSLMSEYFKVINSIDNEKMYFIKGLKL